MEKLPAVGLRHGFRSLPLSLLVGLAAALLAWIFVHLGSEVAKGDTRSFDMVVLSAMQALRADHPWAAAVMRDLSGLGSTVTLTLRMIIPSATWHWFRPGG